MSTRATATKIGSAFWDTSTLVPLSCQQDESQGLRQIARRTKRTVMWWGATVEAYSAFSRLVREGKMPARGFKQAATRLEAQRNAWIEMLPSERVRQIAETLPALYGLRALNSFQLAAALVWCKEQPRNRLFVCCDEHLVETAAKVGFDILP